LYLALDCRLVGTQKLDPMEEAAGLEVLLMSKKRVCETLDKGEIAAMSSVAAGYRAMRRLTVDG